MSIKPYELRNGNCKELIKQLADNSIDAIVTDPPYELGFMGKKWDATGIAYDAELWAECLRVLKPGGHLLAFSGSRTYHRMAVAIEDAGFDIRDQIMWVYGSGFPKSHDVSKAIDKRGGVQAGFVEFRDAVKDAMKRNGISRAQLQNALGNFMLSHYLTAGSQPAVPNLRDYRIIRDTVGLGNEWNHLFNDEAEREILGNVENGGLGMGNFTAEKIGAGGYGFNTSYNITAPATDAAKEWNGWGTALKPAHEPICVARKPLIGTVAENVLQYGTGAFNIDGCRVGGNGKDINDRASKSITAKQRNTEILGNLQGTGEGWSATQGRWPANLIHDGSAEVLAGFPNVGASTTSKRNPNGSKNGFNKNGEIYGEWGAQPDRVTGYNEPSGSAARFFYCAKASKRDRDEGCGELEEKTAGQRTGRAENSAGITGYAGAMGPARNYHPTVKPTDLMRYLCRLVTPPNGLILDPFTGSGSTGKAAILEGFRFLGFEMEPQYIEIATARIEYAIEQKSKQKTEQENTLFGGENE